MLAMPNSTTVVAFALKLLDFGAATGSTTASATRTVADIRCRVALTLVLPLPLISLIVAFRIVGIHCDVGIGCSDNLVSLFISDVFIHLIQWNRCRPRVAPQAIGLHREWTSHRLDEHDVVPLVWQLHANLSDQSSESLELHNESSDTIKLAVFKLLDLRHILAL